MEEVATAERRLRIATTLRSNWMRAVLGLAVVGVAFFWALPAFASYDEVWSRLGDISPGYGVALAAVGAVNLAAPASVQCAALPGLRFTRAIPTDWTTSAITNTVPGGSAMALGVTWTMYRSFGLGNGPIARAIVVTGVWDTFVKFGTPLLALGWLSTQRPVTAGFVQAAVLGAGLFVVVVALGAILLAGPATARRIGRLLDRVPVIGDGWPDRLTSLRADTVELLRNRWPVLSLFTIAGHGNLFLLLLVCLRAVGVSSSDAPAAAVLAAFAFGRLITAVPLTPGGLGVMEVGLTGALLAVTGYDGSVADEATIVAGVLLFRFLTFATPIPLGLVMWLLWTSGRLTPTTGKIP